ncbi:MAG TPA: hypothetical protein VM933_10745 [Acidimicrobiales bacterium]|nr:hypothetical protein [Acidimicrobiales bacterium]
MVALVREARQGNDAAWEALYRRAYPGDDDEERSGRSSDDCRD